MLVQTPSLLPQLKVDRDVHIRGQQQHDKPNMGDGGMMQHNAGNTLMVRRYCVQLKLLFSFVVFMDCASYQPFSSFSTVLILSF